MPQERIEQRKQEARQASSKASSADNATERSDETDQNFSVLQQLKRILTGIRVASRYSSNNCAVGNGGVVFYLCTLFTFLPLRLQRVAQFRLPISGYGINLQQLTYVRFISVAKTPLMWVCYLFKIGSRLRQVSTNKTSTLSKR